MRDFDRAFKPTLLKADFLSRMCRRRDIGVFMPLTTEYVRECLDYNPETGAFTWRERPRSHFKSDSAWRGWNLSFPGRHAGTKETRGYIQISLNNKRYMAHRLAWLHVHGENPEREVDHKNGVKCDNRIQNLRQATRSQNQANMPANTRNKLGVKGVHWNATISKYQATIQKQGQKIHLGVFDSLSEASEAYKRAAHQNYGEFARAE